jgi:2,4-dienoyl-CoA reductase-like NADH-dependent reductase (Old Yellow Enzyme family)/thioredoxin reductase
MLIKKPADKRFPRLFTPGYIGDLWVKNRVVRTPMLTNLALNDGSVTQRHIDHYKEFARGGAGMIIVEYCYIDEDASKSNDGQISISNAAQQPGLYWLANAIKNGGARATVQIAHGGRQRFKATKPYKSAYSRAWPDIYKYGGVGQQGKGGAIPDEMTISEIQQCIEDFGSAALRAKEVGFDACELHGGHGYLITNFLSPWNQRPDWYGGSFDNRKRFILQAFENMRNRVGPDYPLGVRLSGTDYDPVNPIPIEETIRVAQELEELGANYIHVTGGIHEFAHKETVAMYLPMAYQAWASGKIKKAVKIPVICSGSLGDPELAEKILKDGKGDFVGLGRPLIADPHWTRKAQEGHPEDIRPCIRCMECTDRGVNLGYITCTVNATAGREGELCKIPEAKHKKKIAVVGGGPGGMEAARVAALKGHDVTLYEKRKLGGMLIEAAIPDFKSDLKPLIEYHITQLKKTRVKVLKEEATVTKIKNGKYDAVIVAAGSQPIIPNVPGIKKPIVVTGLDVLHGAKTGNKVIVVGGGMVGSEIALFLAKQGKKVTIVEALDNIAEGLSVILKAAFFDLISQLPIQQKCRHVLIEVTDDGIVTLCGLKKEKIKGDTVVIAMGFSPNRKLWDELCKIPELEVYAIGDCIKVQTSYDAIHDGFNTAFSLISD